MTQSAKEDARMVNYLKMAKFGFSMASKSIGRRKFLATLTILGILIGTATIVSLMSVGEGMQYGIESSLKKMLGAAIMLRSSDQGVTVPEYVRDYVLRIPGVKDCVPVIMMLGEVGDRQSMIIGVNLDQAGDLLQITLSEGRIPHPGEKCPTVISGTTANRLGLHLNDTITLSGTTGGVGESFTVVGISRSVSVILADAGCFIPLRDAQRLFNKAGFVSTLLVILDDPSKASYVEYVLRNLFPESVIMTQETVLESISDIMNLVNGVLLALGSISLVVGAIGVMNTVTMTVYERTREIGMIKAIGGRRMHVLLIFISEATIIGMIGGCLGIIFGILFVYLIQYLISTLGLQIAIPIIISPQIMLIGFVTSLAMAIMAGSYPSWKAANIRPVEALK